MEIKKKPEMVFKSAVIVWPQVRLSCFRFLPSNPPVPFDRESCFFLVCGAGSCITSGFSTPCERGYILLHPHILMYI